MIICTGRIQKAHPKVDPNIIAEIVEELRLSKRLDNQSLQTIMVKHGANKTLMKNLRTEIQKEITFSKVMDLKMRAESPAYKTKSDSGKFITELFAATGIDKFITDLFATSVDNVKGSALSISALKEQYANKYAHTLDMAMLDIDKRSISMVKGFDVNESAELLKAINGKPVSDKVIENIGAAFRTMNDASYSDKAHKGFMVLYRENYGFRRFYDAEKIDASGFAKFSSDILHYMDLHNSKMGGVTKENIEEILDLINRNATDDEFLKAADKNELLGSIKIDMDNWKAEYDPYDIGTSSKLYDSTGRQASRKQRTYVFKDEISEMTFMKEYGLYGTDIYSYIKNDLRRSSTELAFGEVFGPNIKDGFDAFVREMHTKAIASGSTKAEADSMVTKAERMYAYASGNIVMAPAKLSDIDSAKGAFAYGSNGLINLTNAGVLVASAITQLGDLPQSYLAYMFKNKQSLIVKMPKMIYHTMGAAVDAMRKDVSLRKYGEYVTDFSIKVLGDIDGSAARMSAITKTTNAVMSTVGVNYMNRVSSILNIRLMTDLMKNPKYLANAEKVLGRYNLKVNDLEFVSTLLTNASHMDLQRIPNSFFDNNPRGLTGEVYKKAVADKFGMFMRENMRHGAATKGFREQLQLAFGTEFNNQTNISSSVVRMLTQLKGVPTNIFNSSRYMMNNYPITENPYANGVMHMGLNVAVLGTAFLGLDYLKKLIQNDFDENAAYEDMTRGQGLANAYLRSVMRSSALSIFLEPFSGAMYDEDIISSIAGTPSAKVVTTTGKLAGKLALQIPNYLNPNMDAEEILDKRMSKEMVKNYSNLVPYANLRFYLPFIDAGETIDKNIVEYIDSLGE